jgi:hypothetical protein
MDKKLPVKMRQILNWKAALWAGLIAGTCFFLLNIFIVPLLIGGNMWVIVRLFASIFIGEAILAPPSTFDLFALLISFSTTLIFSIVFSVIIAFVFHKWGLLVGIIGGALFGLGIYLVNFYSLSFFFPWFFALSSWPFVLTHVLFGAVAGGFYEHLEIEIFETID